MVSPIRGPVVTVMTHIVIKPSTKRLWVIIDEKTGLSQMVLDLQVIIEPGDEMKLSCNC